MTVISDVYFDVARKLSKWRKHQIIKFSQIKVFFISNLRDPSVNRKDLQAISLEGPPRENPEPDLVAVVQLDNPLSISPFS